MLQAIVRFYRRAGLWALWGLANFVAGGIYVALALVAAGFVR